MIINIILLIVGFALLMKGADFFVEGASAIAERFKIPQIVIGLTIVAFGTSAPEAAISINAALKGNAGITVGNVVGSNIMNILLILGLASIIATLSVKKNTVKYEIPFVIVVTCVLLALGVIGNELSRIDGIILWVLFIIFFIYLIKTSVGNNDEQEESGKKLSVILTIIFTLGGMAAIIFGSDITVKYATLIAKEFGMSDRLIGLTIVAFGTSLPELITSCTAAIKGKTDIAIGNIVGSNIFNILFVVGTSALICPVTFENSFITDTVVAIFAAALLLLLSFKKLKITRKSGIIMLACYLVYFGYIIFL